MIKSLKAYYNSISITLGGVFMASEISREELDIAVSTLEKLLNDDGGEYYLEAIKRYKDSKNLNTYSLKDLTKSGR